MFLIQNFSAFLGERNNHSQILRNYEIALSFHLSMEPSKNDRLEAKPAEDLERRTKYDLMKSKLTHI